jgi:hypothetical protein
MSEIAKTAAARRRRRKLRKRGVPNTLPADIARALLPADGTEWGPAMRALPSDRHRAFVLAMYEVPKGFGAQVKAAKMAGFGTSTSSPQSWSVIASLLAHDARVLAALHEEDQKRIRASAPRAVRALAHLVETPGHRDHVRAVGMVLDRVHPVETTHNVRVDHRVEHRIEATDKVLERIRVLALAAGLNPQTLPPMIDGACEDITEQQPARTTK